MRDSLPNNRMAECRACGQRISYYGRRDLVAELVAWHSELEQAFKRSGGALIDAACGTHGRMANVLANVRGFCLGCMRGVREPAPPPQRQLDFFPEEKPR